MINLYYLFFLFSISETESDFSYISCTEFGFCARHDAVKLIPNWYNKNLLNYTNFTQVDNGYQAITSKNLFENATSLNYLIGSKAYVCADGFGECYNTCCSDGVCKDPANVCINNNNNQKIYLFMVIFIFLGTTIIYWIVFSIIGIRYRRRMNLITKNKEGGQKISGNRQIHQMPELTTQKKFKEDDNNYQREEIKQKFYDEHPNIESDERNKILRIDEEDQKVNYSRISDLRPKIRKADQQITTENNNLFTTNNNEANLLSNRENITSATRLNFKSSEVMNLKGGGIAEEVDDEFEVKEI